MYTGEEAVELGLVDACGGLPEAIRIAKVMIWEGERGAVCVWGNSDSEGGLGGEGTPCICTYHLLYLVFLSTIVRLTVYVSCWHCVPV